MKSKITFFPFFISPFLPFHLSSSLSSLSPSVLLQVLFPGRIDIIMSFAEDRKLKSWWAQPLVQRPLAWMESAVVRSPGEPRMMTIKYLFEPL